MMHKIRLELFNDLAIKSRQSVRVSLNDYLALQKYLKKEKLKEKHEH